MGKKQNARKVLGKTGLELPYLEPQTDMQEKVFNSEKHMVLKGAAGTGKTFCALYLALEAIQEGYFDRIVIIRSAVPSRDIGFLPGSYDQKIESYQEPYIDNVNKIFGRDDAYGILVQKGIIQFATTSYLRGTTLDDAVIIVDEAQNMNFQELDTVMTRPGEYSRFMLIGDTEQNDLQNMREESGFGRVLNIIRTMNDYNHDYFETFEFGLNDVVRGPLVKAYLEAKAACR